MNVVLRTMPLNITLDGQERWVNGLGPLGSRMTDRADAQVDAARAEQEFARMADARVDDYLRIERDPEPTDWDVDTRTLRIDTYLPGGSPVYRWD